MIMNKYPRCSCLANHWRHYSPFFYQY
uniref:Uncharacterized protein n=1 Tax=Arundo donax TaxID=35708 RepID=A0A0A8Z2H1_ARUDO